MGQYKNPIPSVDDEYESKYYYAGFQFNESVTLEEALNGINNIIAENNGKLPSEFVRVGSIHSIRYKLPQNK